MVDFIVLSIKFVFMVLGVSYSRVAAQLVYGYNNMLRVSTTSVGLLLLSTLSEKRKVERSKRIGDGDVSWCQCCLVDIAHTNLLNQTRNLSQGFGREGTNTAG